MPSASPISVRMRSELISSLGFAGIEPETTTSIASARCRWSVA